MNEHFVVLGLARVRAPWFRDVSRWATSAALPVDFVMCVSPAELDARLASGRALSAVLVDGALPALDRDLVDRARQAGCAVLVVDDGTHRRDWSALAVGAVLPAPLDRAALLAALRDGARPVSPADRGPAAPGDGGPPGTGRGRLAAVTGAPGSGTSVLAMALAQGWAARQAVGPGPGEAGPEGGVALADLALHADQAVLHDVGDVVPALQELVEAHRSTTLAPAQVRSLTSWWEPRGYHLLAGLRRHRDWAALPPRATDAALDALRRSFALVVADVDADVEGEDDCGSVDVEERNHLARAVLGRADVVVVSLRPTVAGLHRAVRVLDDLARFGVGADRLLPVVVGAPRSPAARAEVGGALGRLARAVGPGLDQLPSPLALPARRRLDELLRDGAPLPRTLCAPVATAVAAVLDRVPPAPEPEPAAIAPGSLGVSGP